MFMCSSSISSEKDVKKFINKAFPGLHFSGKNEQGIANANSGKKDIKPASE
ncbi:MAG: hypothetical protein ACLFSY_10415 [Desulfonatronovibrionaceae bacterium]